MLICVRCNQVLNEGEKFCHLCAGLGVRFQNARQISTPVKNKDPSSTIASPFGAFCIFFVVLAAVLFADEIFIRLRATEANTGIVVHRGGGGPHGGGAAWVAHYVNGVRYTGRLRGFDGSDAIRWMEEIRIFYNPANPRQIRPHDIKASQLFLAIGFGLLALLFLIALISKAKEEWEERKECG